jgi:hypothetical protein
MSSADVRLQTRFDTAEQWLQENPVLLAGEVGAERDTARLKVGDGVRAWLALPYVGEGLPLSVDGGMYTGAQ